MPVTKNGVVLRTVDDWFAHAPPKSPDQWVDGRSAKETAVAWLSSGPDLLPPEVAAVLASHTCFGEPLQWHAEAEAKLPFDEFKGEPRNSDLLVDIKEARGRYVLAVEAKADESFSETIRDVLENALERRIRTATSRGLARIEQLAAKLLLPETSGLPAVGELRYQLLTACAGALAEARRRNTTRAVMLVHEFVTDKTLDEKHARNAADLAKFLHRLAGTKERDLLPGRLYGPYRTAGWPDLELFIGKAVRMLRSASSRNGVAPSARRPPQSDHCRLKALLFGAWTASNDKSSVLLRAICIARLQLNHQ